MVKKVLITGANKGIGFETARVLGKSGWEVLLGARNKQRGIEAVKKLEIEGIRAEWIEIDLNNFKTIHSASDYISKNHSNLNALINNAGIPGNMKTHPLDVSIEELKKLTEVNFWGNFEMIKVFTPILAKNNGKILNVTIPSKPSIFLDAFSYTASKAGLNSMIQLFGREFKKNKIPVEIFGVIPGGITTDLNDNQKGIFMRSAHEGGVSIARALISKKRFQGKILIRVTPFKLFSKNN